MTQPIPYIPPNYQFLTFEGARAFCDTVNAGENCNYVQPIMYDGETWGVLCDDVTSKYQ